MFVCLGWWMWVVSVQSGRNGSTVLRMSRPSFFWRPSASTIKSFTRVRMIIDWERALPCSRPSSHTLGSKNPPLSSSWTKQTCYRRKSQSLIWQPTSQTLLGLSMMLNLQKSLSWKCTRNGIAGTLNAFTHTTPAPRIQRTSGLSLRPSRTQSSEKTWASSTSNKEVVGQSDHLISSFGTRKLVQSHAVTPLWTFYLLCAPSCSLFNNMRQSDISVR